MTDVRTAGGFTSVIMPHQLTSINHLLFRLSLFNSLFFFGLVKVFYLNVSSLVTVLRLLFMFSFLYRS